MSEIQGKIDELARVNQLNINELMDEYNKLLGDPFIKDNPAFISDRQKADYCLQWLITRHVARVPVKNYEVLPIGFSPIRASKSGFLGSDCLALVRRTENPPEKNLSIRRVVFSKGNVDSLKKINLYNRYQGVKLGEYSGGKSEEGGGGKDLFATTESKFEGPEYIGWTGKTVVEGLLKANWAKRIIISETPYNLSRKDSQGYTDRLDLRIIRAMISRSYRGANREDGQEYGTCTINDMSVLKKTAVKPASSDEEGIVVTPNFTVWCHPVLIPPDKSVCDFIGYLDFGKQDKEIFMRAYTIVPEIEGPREG